MGAGIGRTYLRGQARRRVASSSFLFSSLLFSFSPLLPHGKWIGAGVTPQALNLFFPFFLFSAAPIPEKWRSPRAAAAYNVAGCSFFLPVPASRAQVSPVRLPFLLFPIGPKQRHRDAACRYRPLCSFLSLLF